MQSVSIRNVLGKDAGKVLAQVLVSVEFNVEWDYRLMAIRRHAELGKSRSLLMTYRLDVILSGVLQGIDCLVQFFSNRFQYSSLV